MNYTTITMCAVIGLSIQSMQEMIASKKTPHEYNNHDYQSERAAFWKIDPASIAGKSSDEIKKIIDGVAEERYKKQGFLRILERLYLEGEGFCGPLPKPEQTYEYFWRGKGFGKD